MPAVYGVLTAMALGIAEIAKHANTRVQKVGDVCYLVEPGTGKPIYSFTEVGGTPTVSIIASVSSETIRRRAVTGISHHCGQYVGKNYGPVDVFT